MKIIFLDVDGVLNNDAALSRAFVVGCPTWALDRTCIEHLRDLVAATNAKIVLSSSWRGDPDKEVSPEFFLRAVLAMWNIGIMDRTPHLPRKFSEHIKRGEEIQAWIDQANDNKQFIDAFVILDDLSDAGFGHKNKFIQTNPKTGLTADDVLHAKLILENQNPQVKGKLI